MVYVRTLPQIVWALVGALPLLTAHFWYKIGLIAFNEIGLIRTLGLLGALGAMLVAAAVIVAVGAWPWFRVERPRAERWLRTAFFAGAIGNFASVGLSLYYWAPSLAPIPVKVAAAAAVVVLLAAFLRYRDEDQIFVTGFMSRFGLCLLLVPVLASPWIGLGAMGHTSRLEGAVAPPSAPALKPDRPARILLVTFDALAAGRTTMHNPSLATTPTLARLAEEGAWFSNCRSASDGTLVSLGTVLTGLSPRTIQPQLHNKMGYIPFNAVTGVSGFLRQAGYRSFYATMIAHPSAFGLLDEFEAGAFNARHFFTSNFHSRHYLPVGEALSFTWNTVLRDSSSKNIAGGFQQHPLPAIGRTFEQAHQLMRESTDPTFMWVHIGAPHLPYVRVGERGRFVSVEEAHQANTTRDPAHALEIQGVYDDYVTYVDTQLGQFFQRLEQDGLWSDTLVIVTSDHGESHQPGRIGHGGGALSKEQAHVPLVIRSPRQRLTGRHDQVVGHVDLVPTILASVYRDLPAGLPGHSLWAPSLPERALFTYGWVDREQQSSPLPRSIAAYEGRFTYTFDFTTRREALLDAIADPLERLDVADRHPVVRDRLRALVEQERAAFER